MRLTRALSLLTAALAAPTLASPAKRQGPQDSVILELSYIEAPTDGTSVTAGQPFTFGVASADWNHCNPGYTSLDVYLLDSQPTTSSLNTTYGFSNYLYYFGHYVIVNDFGLPPMGTPPPSSLTAPGLGSSYSGQEIYLAVISNVAGCPPDGYTEWVIDSVELIYNE